MDAELKTITVTEVVVQARSGRGVADCLREAALLALTEQRHVRLLHNEDSYVANPNRVRFLFQQDAGLHKAVPMEKDEL